MGQSQAVKTFEDLFAELGERARSRPPGSATVAALDAGVHTLGKKILEEAGYTLRYERGTFQSGYCILEARKVVVLNRFLQTEGRINTLIDLMTALAVDPMSLSPDNRRLLQELTGRAEQPVRG